MGKLELVQNQLWDSMRSSEPLPEILEANPILRDNVVNLLADRLVLFKPSAVIALPEKSAKFAEELSMELGCMLIETKFGRTEESKNLLSYRTEANRMTATRSIGRIIILDTVFKSKTNVLKANSLPGIRDNVMAVATVWKTSPPERRHRLPFENFITLIEGNPPSRQI